MIRVISQETFDAVVTENMEEFGMDRIEAVQEAQQQFQTQGVNLDNIVTDSAEIDHPMVQAIKFLATPGDASPEDLGQRCDIIAQECAKGLAERVMATKHKAYEILVQTTHHDEIVVQSHAMQALKELLNGNPDPLEPEGFKALLKALNETDANLIQQSLGVTLNCCVRHEGNRQNFIRNGLLIHLNRLYDTYPIEVVQIWQALVQDDDVRVPFGQAHEHAREIVEEHSALTKLTQTIGQNSNPKELPLILSCLSSLCVRNEYCQAVAADGGLKVLLELLVDPDQTKDVVGEVLKLIKALAGNDNVKRDILKLDGIRVIVNSMSKYTSVKLVAMFGSSALTAVSLRSPENATAIMACGGGQLLTQILKIHMNTPKILISCCNAIRNIVSRSRELTAEFVELDIEDLLNKIRRLHPSAEDAVKAALRDLGLKVDLKEIWTGGAVKNE
eukprot:TCALIF_10995-PA protein Name:"Similar to Armc6 Armadillo repeat-containing protein 6 (Mus musculus)" AED:0.06 eAED:0.06 QI:0/0.8/0.66/0.83/0.6/0.66/6/268/445